MSQILNVLSDRLELLPSVYFTCIHYICTYICHSTVYFARVKFGPLSLPLGAGRGSSVGCAPAWYADDRWFDPHARQHSFVETGREIVSSAILSDSRRAVVSYFRKNVH